MKTIIRPYILQVVCILSLSLMLFGALAIGASNATRQSAIVGTGASNHCQVLLADGGQESHGGKGNGGGGHTHG